ncbi:MULTISPECIES: hypothetical protein [Rhodococcus]|uniref:hypothetical protein n=1 Tax=Rhodococcus TaxID=1827 RepID=UPI000622CD9B|nr:MULTISPECIES: hypothetical protein [Rhodococcus]AKE89222.1 hypothetical protein AAT18_08190 [Rhodococcus aetherivorans]PND51865.1 hypothetical protein CQZ88_11920 [Rhodococcus sp. ENV425]WKX00328.1 hypothetical protein Q3O43_08540 [Rhodococcus aetherivorans]
MFAAGSGAVTLPSMVLGGLRPLYRQMARANVRTVGFVHTVGANRFEVRLTAAVGGPTLDIRSRDRTIAFTVPLTAQFRAQPELDPGSYRTLCAMLTPDDAPAAGTVVRFLQGLVAQAPAVLSRTDTPAA